MKLVLDTNALWHPPLWRALDEAHASGLIADGQLDVVVPTLVYAERMRQLRRDGHDLERWKHDLWKTGARLEPFGAEHAENLDESAVSETTWRKHSRDLLVAAHVRGDQTAVTDDVGPAWAGKDRVTAARATQLVEELIGR